MEHTIASYLMLTIFFVLTMAFLFQKDLYQRASRVRHALFALLGLWWVVALLFEAFPVKMYGALLVIAAVVEELRVRKRRSSRV